MAEHKHAAVLRAIADGKAVQCLLDGESWIDIDAGMLNDSYDPFTFSKLEWRIKPEPKPDVVCVGRAVPNAWGFHAGLNGKPNLRLVFDGENPTKLKSAEVLP